MKERIVRRLVAVIAAGVLATAVGCGTTDRIESTPDKKPAFSTVKSGVLTIGSDIPYPPFEFKDKGGKLVGFDVELFDAVATDLGYKTEWVDVVYDTIFTTLASGRFDVVVSSVTAYAPAGSPASKDVEDRRKIVAFSKAYYSSLQSLAVNKKRSPNLTSTEGLKRGDRVGVQSGTTGESWAKQNLESSGVVLVKFPKAPAMFQSLEAGQLVGIVNDLPVSLDAIKSKPDLGVVQQIETGEQYGVAIRKENPNLVTAVDRVLDKLFGNGTYARIFKKYFPDQKLPSYAKV